MSTSSPIVSVVIPWKNREELLLETVNSLRGQSVTDWEAILVHDLPLSPGNALRDLADADSRINLYQRGRVPEGAAACRNTGVEISRGDYIVFLDSDDLLAPSCLEQRVNLIEKNPDLDFAVFLSEVFHQIPGDVGRLWNQFTEEDDLDRFLRRDLPWQTMGPIWRRESLARLGPWNEKALTSQEWELSIRALSAGFRYKKTNQVDSYWRESQQGTITSAWQQPRRIINRMRLYRDVAGLLKTKGLLTRRRKLMMTHEYHLHAFVMTRGWRRSLLIWKSGWRAGAIPPAHYWILMIGEIVRRASQALNYTLFSILLPSVMFSSTLRSLPAPRHSPPERL
jgi:glycosyltransferase involved in cell wall biosynthesis